VEFLKKGYCFLDNLIPTTLENMRRKPFVLEAFVKHGAIRFGVTSYFQEIRELVTDTLS
jgi:hypothetical protein